MNTIERCFREKMFCASGMRTCEPISILKSSFLYGLGPLSESNWNPSTNLEQMGALSFSPFSDSIISFCRKIDMVGSRNEFSIEWLHFCYVNAIIFPVDR